MSDFPPGKRLRTRRQLAQVAWQLFGQSGFETVTMEQVAVAAGVARGTLYNHFPVKEALLVEAIHARLAEDLGMLHAAVLQPSGFVARVAVLWQASADWWEAHRAYAAPYIGYRFRQLREGNAAETASDMRVLYEQLIASAQAQGELADGRPAPRLAGYLHFLYLAAMMEWLECDDRPLAEALVDALAFFDSAAGRAR